MHQGTLRAEGRGFCCMWQSRGRGAEAEAAEPKTPMRKGCSQQCSSWVQVGCDSVRRGQKEKEVGVAEIWNARSPHKSFSWKELKDHSIKMVFRKNIYIYITEYVRRSLSQRYLLGVPVGQAACYWGHAVHPRAVSWAALFPPCWASAGREVSSGWCQRDRPPLG